MKLRRNQTAYVVSAVATFVQEHNGAQQLQSGMSAMELNSGSLRNRHKHPLKTSRA